MNSRSANFVLNNNPFFRDLSPALLRILEASASFEHFETHHYLFYQGRTSDSFYVVLGGQVAIQVYAGEAGSVTIDSAGPGSVLGWTWLLPPYEWVFSGEATEPTEVLKFDGRKIREACDANNDLGYEMARSLTELITERLRETRLKLVTYL